MKIYLKNYFMVNNRTSGHNWERDVVNYLKKWFPTFFFGTTRKHSKALDDQKVDIYTEFPLEIQCKVITKNSLTLPLKPLHELKEFRDNDTPKAVFFKFFKKGKKRRKKVGEYVLMSIDDWNKLINNEF